MKTLAKLVLGITLLALMAAAPTPAAAQPAAAIVVTQTLHDGVLDFQYPRVVGLPDAAAQDTINAAIGRRVAEFRHLDAEVAMARYEVRHNGDGLLSLTMTFYLYSGGAHGMTYMRGLTFDLATGREYRLTDLVPYAGGGRAKIDAAIAAQLKKRDIPLLQTFDGIGENPDFYLAADGRPVVFFQLYELAAYVYGILEFPLPFNGR
ncbi:DUF3298 and DUF4163 domain-containing protein [Anaeroselena agilis]|uniref:DUF3298 and DUF4163 domain-containing protein n=1 Tax=Anaeroselena agilis TaxID=3063788 RepID=A0ABU3P3L5_9FIRM|nr:DUF3298 and DUF4163 domain-containing protein [Selenomonadales bacterium 4137-cl]